ncbi:MAG: hypothetical protein IPM92_14310 [Saprospiraceae bacterium]|nr:hypothetical protein [Saprospiraceae bacterium]
MNSGLIFKLGLVANVLLIILSVSGMYLSRGSEDGFSPQGKILAWLIPVILSLLIMLALFLRNKGNMTLANILLWIPATPFIIGVLITGFLALVFNLFGK